MKDGLSARRLRSGDLGLPCPRDAMTAVTLKRELRAELRSAAKVRSGCSLSDLRSTDGGAGTR
jgi:hypothetical protein